MSDAALMSPVTLALTAGFCLPVLAVGAGNLYLYRLRGWPPVRRGLMLTMQWHAYLAQLIWFVSLLVWYGLELRQGFCPVWLPLSAVGSVYYMATFHVKIRRFYNIYVRHTGKLMPLWLHLGLFVCPIAVLAAGYAATGEFNPATQRCEAPLELPTIGAQLLVSALSMCHTVYMGVQLRRKASFNFFGYVMIGRAGWLGLGSMVYFILAFFLLSPFLPVLAVSWMVISIPAVLPALLWLIESWEYVVAWRRGDEAFQAKYERILDQSLMDAPMEQLLQVSKLRDVMKKYSELRFAEENIQFLEELFERDKLEDWFETQVVTMRIINTYIREGSDRQVNISAMTRQEVMSNPNITDPAVFDRARFEVLRIVELDIAPAFKKTSEFSHLKSEAEAEGRVQEILAKLHPVSGPFAYKAPGRASGSGSGSSETVPRHSSSYLSVTHRSTRRISPKPRRSAGEGSQEPRSSRSHSASRRSRSSSSQPSAAPEVMMTAEAPIAEQDPVAEAAAEATAAPAADASAPPTLVLSDVDDDAPSTPPPRDAAVAAGDGGGDGDGDGSKSPEHDAHQVDRV